eukprot:scaffold375_cov378-Prasinococcus_capsulatus_cf.AAC.1
MKHTYVAPGAGAGNARTKAPRKPQALAHGRARPAKRCRRDTRIKRKIERFRRIASFPPRQRPRRPPQQPRTLSPATTPIQSAASSSSAVAAGGAPVAGASQIRSERGSAFVAHSRAHLPSLWAGAASACGNSLATIAGCPARHLPPLRARTPSRTPDSRADALVRRRDAGRDAPRGCGGGGGCQLVGGGVDS